jgi:hypothetical protein
LNDTINADQKEEPSKKFVTFASPQWGYQDLLGYLCSTNSISTLVMWGWLFFMILIWIQEKPLSNNTNKVEIRTKNNYKNKNNHQI